MFRDLASLSHPARPAPDHDESNPEDPPRQRGLLRELVAYARARRRWWLLPIIGLLALLARDRR